MTRTTPKKTLSLKKKPATENTGAATRPGTPPRKRSGARARLVAQRDLTLRKLEPVDEAPPPETDPGRRRHEG